MSVNATWVLDFAAGLLNDASEERWSREKLQEYLTDALREIALFLPSALGQRETVQLDQGAQQSVPDTAIRFLGGVRNMGSIGSTPGRRIHNTSLADLEAVDPDWAQRKPAATVRECLYDDADPRAFWVYPPAPDPATTPVHVEIKVVPTITEIDNDNEDDDLPVTEDYGPALVNAVVAFALSTNTDEASLNRAVQYGQAFYQAIGAREQVKARIGPRQKEDQA